jgi:DNA relaxase NicK
LHLDTYSLSLGRIDICFSRPNDRSDTSQLFDAFLVGCRSQVQDHTNTKYIKLENFPNGKMLKVNRRNNSRHYRIYKKDGSVRFELELKHRQTKLVQDLLFDNKLDIFEHCLVIQYFRYSEQILRSGYLLLYRLGCRFSKTTP